jgi:hypothetical protein
MSKNVLEEHIFEEYEVMTQDNVKQGLSISRHNSAILPLKGDMDRRIKDVMVADNDIKLDGHGGLRRIGLSITGSIGLLAALIWQFELMPILKTNPAPLTKVASLNASSLTSWQEPVLQESVLQVPVLQQSVLVSPIITTPVVTQIVETSLPVTTPPALNLAQKLAEKPIKMITPENREQAQANIARAERIIAETKDISTARLFLERALQLGEPKAALLLGETYDSARLKQFGVKGIASDTKRARDLYEQAFSGGVVDAKTRLNELK